LAAEEILVQTSPREGLAVMSDKGLTVAIDANLTADLRAEGLAREIVRRIQEMRKKAGFNIEDRIVTAYDFPTGDALEAVFKDWGEYLASETLSTSLINGEGADGAYREEHDIDGSRLVLAVKRVS